MNNKMWENLEDWDENIFYYSIANPYFNLAWDDLTALEDIEFSFDDCINMEYFKTY